MSDEIPVLQVVRSFAAPVDEVFEAWTDPELIQRWLAPGVCNVVECSADARVGGAYRIVVKDPFDQLHITTGVYRELVPGRRIVKTWVYEGPAVKHYPTLLTVDFRATGPESTEITLVQEQLLTEIDRAGNREGWRQCFEKLDGLLQSQSQ